MRSTQPPLIPFSLKTTTRVSVVSSFTDTISSHYHKDPASLQDQIYEFQELRYVSDHMTLLRDDSNMTQSLSLSPPPLPLMQAVSNVTRDEYGLECLMEYHNQLQLVSKRLIHPKIRHGLAFIWLAITHSLTPSLPHSLTHCLTPSLTASLPHCLTPSLTASLPHSLPHSLTPSLTPSLTAQTLTVHSLWL